jgi:hypothetical protein
VYTTGLTNNSAYQGGGGTFDCWLGDCILANNAAHESGGGALVSHLYNCTLTGNLAHYGGGACTSILEGCKVIGNVAAPNGYEDRALGGGAYTSTLRSCLVISNQSAYGTGGGTCQGALYNCTLIGNSPGVGGSGADGGSLYNCISYFNGGLNCSDYSSPITLEYCCTTPLPAEGLGNIDLDPLFVDYIGGNLRLQTNSPCIDAANSDTVTTIADLDGRPRVVGATVDMGAYEFQPAVSGAFMGWLQQYGLPTDGSADYIDSDADGMNNWQEWICATDPTNTDSVLKMLAPARSALGVDVTWLSVTNRTYFVQRSTNLALQPAFVTLSTNLAGQVGSTTFTDTNATYLVPFFYRIGVEQP